MTTEAPEGPNVIDASALQRVSRGEAGRVLRELRAEDFVFTVLETQAVSPTYRRIRCAANGFLQRYTPYPTMWVRLWFVDDSPDGAGHQRAFTLVDPDVHSDTFWLEFAIHDGAASRWALEARPGDAIEASLYGSEPTLPARHEIDHHLLAGDPASLPAINSLLDALSDPPATIVLEWANAQDQHLPVRSRPGDTVRWVRRDGDAMQTAVRTELTRLAGTTPDGEQPRLFAWAACDTVTTRALTRDFKAAGLARENIKTLGYWMPPSEKLAS